ncbi:Chromosome segregation protein SMC [Burkholderia pseudomallei]
MSDISCQTWSYPGARWWKFDFHTHTPASKDTTAWQAVIDTPQALKPETWLLKYMDAGIDCVAVTDHNSGEWIDKLKGAYAEMKRQADAGSAPAGFRELHLFPGVEISVQGGFHLLAIFGPNASSQTDLPPTNRASRSLVKFVFGEEDEHEEALYGTANHRVSEGSRGRYAGQGTVQEAWVQ